MKETWLKRTLRCLRLSRLSLKKKKGSTFSLGLMVVIVVILMISGIKIVANLNDNYDIQAEKLHAEHDFVIMNSETYQDSFEDYLKKDERISEYEIRDCVSLKDAEVHYDGGTITCYLSMENYDQQKGMNHLTITGQKNDVPEDEAIYVPEIMKTKGFRTGDPITFQNEIWSKTYTIAGFFQTTSRGNENGTAIRFYLGNEAFKDLYLSKGVSTEILIRCYDTKEATPVYLDFMSYISDHVESNEEYKQIWGCDYDMMRSSYVFMGMLGAAAVVGFAVIISVITLIVMHFQIQNNIEQSVQKIGVLGALGYTRKEIGISFSGEYLVIAVIGSIVGLLASYLVLPLLGSALMASVALPWSSRPMPLIELAVVMFLIAGIYLTTRLAARKAKKYTPHVALAQGMASHSFRKNTFPLDKRGNVLVRLAGKEWFQMKKQNIMMTLCLGGVTFAVVFSSMLYHSFVSDISLIKKMVGMELSDVQVTLTDYTDPKEVQKLIDAMPEVRKTNLGITGSGNIDDMIVTINVYEDFSKLETENVYEGRLCQYDNELVITGVLAKQLKKEVGDTITVTMEGTSYDYIITGLTQSMSDVGKIIKLTKEGYQKLVPCAHLNTCYIYLNEGVSRTEFIKQIRTYFGLDQTEKETSTDSYDLYQQVAEDKLRTMMNMYGVKEMDYSIYVDGKIISGNTRSYMISKVTDVWEMGQSMMGSMQLMLKIVTYAILAVTALIITMLLAMLIKMMIVKKKIHFGILKSLGYTTPQLMLQITISFMPAVILGVILGTIVCYLTAGALTTQMLSVVGISNMQFDVSLLSIVGVGMLVIVFSFVIAMLEAVKVRKVSVYDLLTE